MLLLYDCWCQAPWPCLFKTRKEISYVHLHAAHKRELSPLAQSCHTNTARTDADRFSMDWNEYNEVKEEMLSLLANA
ncbi:MAG: hypothetical protein E7664_05075 [Ruminococcaceae bacterium]|nr:hypothetical protein [Oscillospiraceae bacterium]